jgi:hypothetical protein
MASHYWRSDSNSAAQPEYLKSSRNKSALL